MKINIGTIIIALVAIVVALLAAWVSVNGMAQLFAGAPLFIMLLVGALEFGKLVLASFLHNYWKRIKWQIKLYGVAAVIVIMIITSTGIYGFLTGAYQSTIDVIELEDRRVVVKELKKRRFQDKLETLQTERKLLSESITQLTMGLSNNRIQYTDSLGNVINTTSSKTRRVLNAQLDDAKKRREYVTKEMEIASDSINAIDIQVLNMKSESTTSAEVGPLKFISETTGFTMSKVVNILAILLIFVFDPFAVMMVIIFNKKRLLDSGEKSKIEIEKNPRELYGEEVKSSKPDEAKKILKDVINTYNESTKEEIVEEKEEIKIPTESKEIVENSKVIKEWETPQRKLLPKEKLEQITIKDVAKHGGNIGGKPYYMHPKFDWVTMMDYWIVDPIAFKYWWNNAKNSSSDISETYFLHPKFKWEEYISYWRDDKNAVKHWLKMKYKDDDIKRY